MPHGYTDSEWARLGVKNLDELKSKQDQLRQEIKEEKKEVEEIGEKIEEISPPVETSVVEAQPIKPITSSPVKTGRPKGSKNKKGGRK